MSSRQQQRQQERALLKRGQSAIGTGLSPTPQKDDIVAVSLVIARILRDASEPARASRAAAEAHALTEASARRTPGAAKLACAKGCGYCCHSWVGATAAEILLLAGAAREAAKRNPQLLPGIAERSRMTIGLSPLQRFGAKLPCPLLADNACQQYRDRPSVCRQTTSLDLSGCIEEFEGRGQSTEIKVSAVYLAHARNARVPLMAALRLAGLPTHIYELSAGLQRALEFGNSEATWLAGGDVFAGIARGPREPEQVEKAIDLIVDELSPLMR